MKRGAQRLIADLRCFLWRAQNGKVRFTFSCDMPCKTISAHAQIDPHDL